MKTNLTEKNIGVKKKYESQANTKQEFVAESIVPEMRISQAQHKQYIFAKSTAVYF